MINFDNVQNPKELTEEQIKAIELHHRVRKQVMLAMTLGIVFTLGFGIVLILVLLKIGILSFHKDALKKDNAASTTLVDDKLATIEKTLANGYVGDSNPDKAIEEACKAYVENYGDKYTTYYTADEYTKIAKSYEGEEFYGIGVKYSTEDLSKGARIADFTKGSPSEEAGMKAGDYIIEVDGTSLIGIDADKTVSLIRGKEGSIAKITVLRDGKKLSFEVKRVPIDSAYVSSSMLKDKKTGYIYISAFTNTSVEQFKEALAKVKEEGASQVIIDVRSNPGGLVSSAVSMLDPILPPGDYGYMESKSGVKSEFRGYSKEKLDLPYAVLVNNNSASSAEIFAAAVKYMANKEPDLVKAKVIGDKTYGKGITQQIVPFADGSALKFTNSHMYTPDGKSWNSEGVIPDIEISNSKESKKDLQLNAALDYLNSLKK